MIKRLRRVVNSEMFNLPESVSLAGESVEPNGQSVTDGMVYTEVAQRKNPTPILSVGAVCGRTACLLGPTGSDGRQTTLHL